MKDVRGNYFLWSEKFQSLNELVEYYKKSSISKHMNICLREDTPKEQQEASVWSLAKKAQEVLQLNGGHGKQMKASGQKKDADHFSSWQHKQERRGRSLDIQDGPQGQKDHAEGGAPSMFRRHTDPIQQPQVMAALLLW
uniref:SH2 domain-containing protein n=1 Tax=Salvator merianae TaxID=96440 RepID=A0A8D0CBA7_SALMN